MNVEQTSELEGRARQHAALGDVSRLRIVDLLRVGDASTSELCTALGLRSNLLAHHVNVLVEAGLVTRRRSEGDARRTYLTLGRGRVAVPASAGPVVGRPPRRVLFVCSANTARSHLAAALWRRASTIDAASAGTEPGERVRPEAVAAAARHGVVVPDVPPRTLDAALRRGDLVITVCDRAHEELGGRDWAHWSVPDPARTGTPRAFERAYAEIAERVSTVAPLLSAGPAPGA